MGLLVSKKEFKNVSLDYFYAQIFINVNLKLITYKIYLKIL